MFKRMQLAQSITEYVLVIGIVSFALAGMNFYLKRGVQAQIKDLTTGLIVEDLYPTGEHQYVSGQVKSQSDVTADSTQYQDVLNELTSSISTENSQRNSTEYGVPEEFEDMLP
jgi:hypothetical protein